MSEKIAAVDGGTVDLYSVCKGGRPIMDFTVPEFDIERNRDRCTLCGACERKECSYKVHFFCEG